MRGTDKIFYPLGGLPLILHSISVLSAHPRINEIVLVTSRRSITRAEALIANRQHGGAITVCAGGERRQDSVRIGLDRLGDCDLVIVHDGARPFITPELLDRGILAARDSGAAVAAVPVKDTIKQSDNHNLVMQTIPRDRLWAVQTPQVFRTSMLRQAHRKVLDTVTDDASIVEALGYPVKVFTGSYYNIKVTTPEDLTIAQGIVGLSAGQSRENSV